MLLCLSQEELAALSTVGVATIRRFETGRHIDAAKVDTLKVAVEAAGAVLMQGSKIDGKAVGEGVALGQDLPPETLRRLELRNQPGLPKEPRKAGRPPKARRSEEG